MRTKKRIRLKGRLRIYMQTSLYMGILLLIVDIGTYLGDKLMNTNVFSGCPCRLSADLLSAVLFWNDHFTDVL